MQEAERATRSVYFIGIGGTAMAGMAAALAKAGWTVTGSDAGVYPPMSDFLATHGIRYFETFSEANLRDLGFPIFDSGSAYPFTAERSFPEVLPAGGRSRFSDLGGRARFPDSGFGASQPLIVIGNAVGRGNPEVEAVLRCKLPHTSLAAFAGEECITGRTSLVVTGTHGKTTTAALAAWVLDAAGRAPGFLIGGIPVNFGEGCRPAAAAGIFVSEGDEYDTAFFDKRSKFVHYRPDILIINNIEFDHADIFASIDEIARSFRQVVNLVPDNGLIFVNGDDPRACDVAAGAHTRVERFGLGDDNDWRAVQVEQRNGEMRFAVEHRDGASLQAFRYALPLSGEFNVRNALGVIAAASALGLSAHEIQSGLSTFRSVRRRMEVIAETGGITVIDDFAHHPTAVRETLAALRSRYPGRRLWALFEPRSNSTTRNIFQNELADAFIDADCVIIGAVHRPERYAPGDSLDSGLLLRELADRGIRAFDIPVVDEMVALVLSEARRGDVIALLSNGRFGGAHAKLVHGVGAPTRDVRT